MARAVSVEVLNHEADCSIFIPLTVRHEKTTGRRRLHAMQEARIAF
jgi:hypothetical protein